ncbi:MAG: 50S ribosomal protein L19e, partial [Candidatus Pacearchaeota archaeon]
MNLKTKKQLAARILGVGVNRIIFDETRLDEIKEALTRQDIKDLIKGKAIKIKAIIGRKVKKIRKTKRREGKIKIKVKKRKREYIALVRKLRKIIKALKKAGYISLEQYSKLRKEIRAKKFKTKGHL